MVADIKINEDSMSIFTPSKIQFLFKNYDMNQPELTSQTQLLLNRAIVARGNNGATADELARRLGVNWSRNAHQYLALLIAKGYIFRKLLDKHKNDYRYYSIQYLHEDEKTVPLKLTIDWKRVIGHDA